MCFYDHHGILNPNQEGINMCKDIPIKPIMIERQLHPKIDVSNYEKIQGVLNSAAKNNVSSKTVLNKYVELAQFYNSDEKYRESVDLLLDAIRLSPTSIDIFSSLGQSIAMYLIQHKDELCNEDVRWASTALEYLHSVNEGPLGAQHQLDHNPGIQLFNKALLSLDIADDVQVETIHTHFLSSISMRQYGNLTPEERKQKVSELIARKLLELEKARKGKGDITDA